MLRPDDKPAGVPAVLNGWLIEGELGRGGMGCVFRARHARTRARAAIKVLLGDYARRPEIVARFRQEAIAVNIINHPGIVRVFDSGELEDGSPYIVMEYLDGRGLRDWFQAVPPADRPRQLVRLGQQIASAMAAAHASKVVHRDLKPENIMVVDDELAPGGSRVKILDFGIAKVLWGGLPEVAELDGSVPPGAASAPRSGTELSTQPASPRSWERTAIATDLAAPGGASGALAVPGGAGEALAVPGGAGEAFAAPGCTGEALGAAGEEDTGDEDALRVLPEVDPARLPTVALQLDPASLPAPEGHIASANPAPGAELAGVTPVPRPSVPQPTMPFTQAGVQGLGTRSYMAPEQERHSGSVDAKADVYSLGVILYELLEGRTPEAPAGVSPPPMSAAVPPDLADLVRRTLSFEPEARPHMAEVASALQRLGRVRREFDEAVSRWARGGRAPRLLPRGKALHELSAWARDIEDLSAVERSFLDAAAAAEARRERLTRMFLGLGVIVLMGMVAVTTVFWLDAARARKTAEAAERAALEKSRLEASARASAQEALQKMQEAQRATEEAFALATKASDDAKRASDDAKSATSAKEAMVQAKRLAEQAELRARRAAEAANAAKAEADAQHEASRSALLREIAALEGERERLAARLAWAERENEGAKAALLAKQQELRATLAELHRESSRADALRQELNATSERLADVERQLNACVVSSRTAPRPARPGEERRPPPDEDEDEGEVVTVPPDDPTESPLPPRRYRNRRGRFRRGGSRRISRGRR